MGARSMRGEALLVGLRAAPRWARLGVAVLFVDSMLLVAHILHRFGHRLTSNRDGVSLFQSSPIWNGGRDSSLIELFGHLQLGAAGLLLLLLSLRRPGQLVLAAWSVTFLAMAADDRFRLHERAGQFLELDTVQPSLSRLGAQEVGGLIFWAVAVLDLGAVLVVLHRRSSPAVRYESWRLLATIAPLGVVGVSYVLLSAVHPEFLDGPGGEAVVLVRVTVKLLTITAVLVQAAKLWSGANHMVRANPS